MESFIVVIAILLVFGGFSGSCRGGVGRARDRILEGTDDLLDRLGAGGGSGTAVSETSDPAASGAAGTRTEPRATASGGRGRPAGPARDGPSSETARRGAPAPDRSRRPSEGGMSPRDPRRLASLQDRFVRGEMTLEEYEREVDRLDLTL